MFRIDSDFAVISKPVKVIAKPVKKRVSFIKRACAGATAAVVAASSAHATIVTDAQTAIQSAAADGLTVGGYVLVGVGSLIVVGLVMKMLGMLK